jgi:hypothetical protein
LPAVVLLVLLSQVAACLPEEEFGPDTQAPAPDTQAPAQPTETPDAPQARTFPYFLTVPLEEPSTGTGSAPGSGFVMLGVLTSGSFGIADYRYDAYVVTARETGTVSLRSDTLESQRYPYGYGYPLDLVHIDEGFKLSFWGSVGYQNALETGTAILAHQVVKGRQYILLYKTFTNFTPVTYRLTVPSMLTVEGKISRSPEPVPASPNSTGLITLENPRPEVLDPSKAWLDARITASGIP